MRNRIGATGLLMLLLVNPGAGESTEKKAAPTWQGSIKPAEGASAEKLITMIRPISLGDAARAATESFHADPAKIRVPEVELEEVNGYLVYEVDVIDAESRKTHIVAVDVTTGKVLQSTVHGHLWQGSLSANWTLPLAEAEKNALNEVPGDPKKKRAVDAEIEVVNGYIVFEVAVVVAGQSGGYLVTIDAGNGKVLSADRVPEDED